MKRLTQLFPLVLAAALQLLPLLRNIVTSPAAGSSFAIILRWGIGAGAALGTVDAVSGATSTFTSPSSFSGTVGTYFSNNVVCSIGGGNQAAKNDYLYLQIGGGPTAVTSPQLTNSASTTVTLPPGLNFKASWVNGASTIGGILYGTPTTAGVYPTSVWVVSPGNAQLSQNITITISGSSTPTAPAITGQPVAISVAAGKNAAFTVTASGTAPLAYYWSKNNVPLADGGNIAGSATATLTLTSVSSTDAANYSVLVSNAVGTVTSTAAALTVVLPPAITSQPAPQTQAVGGTANFSVTASGTAPLNYFWLKNGATIANGVKYTGVNSSTLTVATLATTDAGNYSVIVSNLAGTATSSAAALAVVSSPTITTPPANVSVIAGANASFTVTAAGSTPLYYQWLKNSAPLADGGNVSGSTTATLNLSAVSANDVANYSVLVSNAVGTVTSSAATLSVLVPPAITSQPAPQTQTVGGTATFSVTASGTAPLNYFWLKNGAAIANGAKYTGVNSSALTVATLATTDAGNYSVIVSNLAGTVTSSAAALAVVSSPTITTPPANVSVIAGANASFTVTAAGSTPLYYQWLKNSAPLADGGNVSGSATATLNLSAVSANDVANYSVIVSNSLGSVTSPAATLTVAIPPAIVTPPASATVLTGSNVSFTVTASGTAPLFFQWLKNGGTMAGTTSATLTLANVSTTDAASYSVVVSNAVGTATSGTATLSVLALPAIVSPPANATVVQGQPASFTVTASGTAPLVFQWLKNGGVIPGANSNVLTLSAVTTNDAGSYSVVVTNLVGSVASSSATLTVLVPPTILTQPADASVAAGSATTFTVVAAGTAPLNYQWYKNSAVIVGATAATLTLTNIASTDAASYSVIIANPAGSVTSGNAVLTVQFPPVIVTQPAGQFGVLGSNIVLSVAANGTGPLSYQWFNSVGALTDGGNLSGSTSNLLTITALTTNEMGSYFVVVSNAFGSVTSVSATISVNASPVITSQPASQFVAVGSNAVLTVTATGTGPFSYQWLRNGAKLGSSKTVIGATSNLLTLAKVPTKASAKYSVVIKNIYGSVTSATATVSVLRPPSLTSALRIKPAAHIAAAPAGLRAKAGTNIVFSITATGSAPLSYQWFKDGTALADGGTVFGSTSNVLKVTVLTTNDSGIYSIIVSNPVGSVNSGTTLIVVDPPVITTPPVSQAVAVSNAVSFSVGNTGTAPFGYRWFKGTKVISGATNATYSLASVTTNNAGNYFVVVTNFAGSVTSAPATLAVWLPPVFTLEATNRTARRGSTTLFSATVSGTAPFNYQWFKDGVPLTDGGNISGSLSNLLTIANLTTNDSGIYVLTVSNLVGSITSSNATLVVRSRSSGGGNVINNLQTQPASAAAVPAPVITQIIRNADGSITLNCDGTTDSNYTVETSADLVNWTLLSTNTTAASPWQVNDPAAATLPARFYRLKLP